MYYPRYTMIIMLREYWLGGFPLSLMAMFDIFGANIRPKVPISVTNLYLYYESFFYFISLQLPYNFISGNNPVCQHNVSIDHAFNLPGVSSLNKNGKSRSGFAI